MGTLPGAHTSIRTAAVALWGLQGLELFLAACWSSGMGVCCGRVVLCALVRAGVRCCVCALPGLRVARAPCRGVLLRRRGDTPSLWRARMAPWRALLAPGCGQVHGSGVCLRGGGLGLLSPRPPPLPLCPFTSACPACLPSLYPLGCPGRMVGLGDLTWCFSPAIRRGLCLLWGVGCSCGAPRRVYGVLGHLAPVHRCARSVCGVVCAASLATWLLFTGVHALRVALRVRCPGPLGSCSLVCLPWCAVLCAPVCVLVVLCCSCRVVGHVVPVHRRARLVCGVVCVVSWAFWLLFSGVLVWCVLCGVCGVLGHLVRALRCVLSVSCGVLRYVWCSVCGVSCVVFWPSRPRFTGANPSVWCFVRSVSWPLGSCSPVCLCGVLWGVCGVLGHLAPVHRCACVVRCVVCTVSWASWLLFTGVRARCAVFSFWYPGPLGSCSPVCVCGVLCGVHSVLGLVASVHRCARSVCGVLYMVSLASWLLLSGVLLWCIVRSVRCPGPLGSCSPVCALGARCFVFWGPGPVGSCSPVCLCCVVCAVSWATWLPFTGVPAWRVLCCVCGVLGLVAPVHRCAICLFCVLCVVCGVLGHVAPVHRCACSVWFVLCVVWVWVCAHVCHTVLVAFFVAPKSRRCRRTPLILVVLPLPTEGTGDSTPVVIRHLSLGAGVGLLLLPLDYEAVLPLAVRGVLQVTMLISGVTVGEVTVDWWGLPHDALCFRDEGGKPRSPRKLGARVIIFDALGGDQEGLGQTDFKESHVDPPPQDHRNWPGRCSTAWSKHFWKASTKT